MKHILLTIVLGVFYSVAQAADVVDQRYIKQMTLGGNTSLKQAAQSIYNTGKKSTKVLDVAAEILIQRYPTADKKDLDTLAWVAKAIGASGNGRYHNILKEVVDSKAHRKLRKYAKLALRKVGKPKGKQYAKGSVDLVAIRKSGKKASTARKAAVKKNSGDQLLDIIVAGMSMEEVYDLVGPPTATTTHQTGKAWNPFNFGRKDVARSVALYKEQGRVVFSHGAYSNTKVLEVIIDPEESGYP